MRQHENNDHHDADTQDLDAKLLDGCSASAEEHSVGQRGKPGTGCELTLREEGDHQHAENATYQMARKQADRIGHPLCAPNELFCVEENRSAQEPEDHGTA